MNVIDRTQAAAEAIAFACIPFFPGFITLTNVAFPGISVVPLPVALVVLALMCALAVVASISLGLARVAPALLRPLLGWCGACLLALVLGHNVRDGGVFVAIVLLGAIWHTNVELFYDRPHVARAIWWSYLISGAIACCAAIAMVLSRVPAAQFAIANGRAVGTFVLPGELAGYCIFLIPIAYAMTQAAREVSLRATAWIALALGCVAMALTFSRTGWVGLAVAIAFLVVMRSSGRARFAQGAVVVVAALIVVALLFNEHHNPSENFTRISIWQAAIGMIDRFPLTGVGPFSFSKIYPLVRIPGGDETAFHAHSMYLTFFAELGIIGLAAFLWLIYSFGTAWYSRVRALSRDAALLSTAITAGVAGALVQGLIDTVSVVIFGLLVPMLALALAAARSGAGDA
jgi:O-antigen ligase